MGELVPLNQLGSMLPQKHSEEEFAQVSSSSEYLPRIQLMTSQSEKCKTGEFPINHYALVKGKDFQDLGQEVDCAVVSWRPKAIRFGEVPMTKYSTEDEEFQRIKEDSEQPNSGCMYGPEFLLWVPAIKQFVTFFCGSKSARREAPTIFSRLGEGMTLASRKIETSSYTWFAPQGRALSSLSGEGPTADDLRDIIAKFDNPKESDVETADNTSERVR